MSRRPALPLLAALLVLPNLAAQSIGTVAFDGTGCPRRSNAIYELFTGGTFDLSQRALRWSPNGEGAFAVEDSTGATTFLPFGDAHPGSTSLNEGLQHHTVSAPLPLGFTYPVPGHATGYDHVTLAPKGYIVFGLAQTSFCCSGSSGLPLILAGNPAFAVFGQYLMVDPVWSPTGTIWHATDTVGGRQVAYFTWDGVNDSFEDPPFSTTCQLQLWDDGACEMIWGSVHISHRPVLVGWSAGGGQPDYGPIDFTTDLPFDDSYPADPLTMSTAFAHRPTIGLPFTIDIANVPATTSLAALLVSASSADIDLELIGMPDCSLLVGSTFASIPIPIASPTTAITLDFFGPNSGAIAFEAQAAVLAPTINAFGVATSNRASIFVGERDPVIVTATGPNSSNNVTTSGFWKIVNGSDLDIVGVRMDWSTSNSPLTQDYRFDTREPNMADRFDGGNSTLPGCGGTYRLNSDVTTGLDYAASIVSPCDPNARTGWVGTNQVGTGMYQTLDFAFTSFEPGDVFEFDCDTDGNPSTGDDMVGLEVTITFANGSVRSGHLEPVALWESRVDL